MRGFYSVLIAILFSVSGAEGERTIKVFVALCDNESQGIAPVGAKIGNGDDPERNLYWGCDDGFGRHFPRSKRWRPLESESDVAPGILRRMKLRHAAGDLVIEADAYRGSEIKKCLVDFEKTAASDAHDLVAFIGHNGLMDFRLTPPEAAPGNDTEVVVLCCFSERYFSERLRRLGCRPVLMTRQLMYPGSFLLHAAIESWRQGGSLAEIRTAAGRAYAKNQKKLSVNAATGVFALLGDEDEGGE